MVKLGLSFLIIPKIHNENQNKQTKCSYQSWQSSDPAYVLLFLPHQLPLDACQYTISHLIALRAPICLVIPQWQIFKIDLNFIKYEWINLIQDWGKMTKCSKVLCEMLVKMRLLLQSRKKKNKKKLYSMFNTFCLWLFNIFFIKFNLQHFTISNSHKTQNVGINPSICLEVISYASGTKFCNIILWKYMN